MSFLNDATTLRQAFAHVGVPNVPNRERLLIVDEETLIALDIQRVVEGAFGGASTIVRNYRQATALTERLREFSLAVVTPPRTPDEHEFARRLVEADIAVVVCSAAMVDLSRTPLAGCPEVDKPFTDEELLAACHTALRAKAAS
jgi:hypothetical protein